MKKFVFNILKIIIILYILDFLFLFERNSFQYFRQKWDVPYVTFFKNSIWNYFFLKRELFNTKLIPFRPIENKNSKEQPILIFGCSGAYGYNFDDKETISHIMSKYSNRPIINRSALSFCVQHILFQLENIDMLQYEDVSGEGVYKNPKYVFYLLMGGDRQFSQINYPLSGDCNEYYLLYEVKNGKLVRKEPILGMYFKSNIVDYVLEKYTYNKARKQFDNDDKKLFNLFILYMKTINELIKENFGKDTKFIILTFEGTKKELWQKQLEEEGIEIVDIAETIGEKDLMNEKHQFFKPPVSPHPTDKLWKALMPKLKEKYPDL